MKRKYFLSIYADICPLASAYAISRRHDQAMGLWARNGGKLILVRYWEFERLTGVKGHALSFPDIKSAHEFINSVLAEEGLSLSDIDEIIGTPGLSTSNIPPSTVLSGQDVAYHSLCHLYSGLLTDSALLQNERILCLSLDAGPDYVADPAAWNKPHYLGAYSDRGAITLFPVPSPALLWALMRERCGLAEGTLMALGSASTVHTPPELFPSPPKLRSIHDRFAAAEWLDDVAGKIDKLADSRPEEFDDPDSLLTPAENRTAALVKIVQAASESMVMGTIEQALKRFAVRPKDVHLSMVGGFALNCPTNGHLMRRFGFKSFTAPPVVNDSGMALGMGLHHAHQAERNITFKLGTAFYGRHHSPVAQTLLASSPSCRIASIDAVRPEEMLEDILKGPLVWFDGNAEIGPRALGHRSLLADPRHLDQKDRLNRIKGREWWRPVAPIVIAESARDWFALDGPSPFMLQAVSVHPHRRAQVPAICHLDGTARVQTVTPEDNPALAALLRTFAEQTGVPILCNTSLNDKGEPIIDEPERALAFAYEKGLEVAYICGLRIRFKPGSRGDVADRPFERPGLRHFRRPPPDAEWMARHNPHNLSRKELMTYFSDPKLHVYDVTRAEDVRKLRRLLSIALRRGGAANTMLAETGLGSGGLLVD